MANYCTTHYVVEGKRETLEKIKNVIKTVAKRYTEEKSDSLNLSGVLIALGLYTEESLREATKDFSEDTPENLGVSGDWHDAEVKELNGNIVLTFTEDYKWNCSCNMEALSKLAPWSDEITAVYRRSEEPGNGIDETTDAEGKYFPKGIKIASGLSAGDFRKIAQQIVEKQFGEK